MKPNQTKTKNKKNPDESYVFQSPISVHLYNYTHAISFLKL